MCIIPFKFHSTLGGKFSYYKGGNWGTSNPNNLPKATELERVGLTPSSLRSVSVCTFLASSPASNTETAEHPEPESLGASARTEFYPGLWRILPSSKDEGPPGMFSCSSPPHSAFLLLGLPPPRPAWLSLHSADPSCRETSPGPGLCPCLCSLYSLMHHRC